MHVARALLIVPFLFAAHSLAIPPDRALEKNIPEHLPSDGSILDSESTGRQPGPRLNPSVIRPLIRVDIEFDVDRSRLGFIDGEKGEERFVDDIHEGSPQMIDLLNKKARLETKELSEQQQQQRAQIYPQIAGSGDGRGAGSMPPNNASSQRIIRRQTIPDAPPAPESFPDPDPGPDTFPDPPSSGSSILINSTGGIIFLTIFSLFFVIMCIVLGSSLFCGCISESLSFCTRRHVSVCGA